MLPEIMTSVDDGYDKRRASKKIKMPKQHQRNAYEPEMNKLNKAAIQNDDDFADERYDYDQFAAGVEDFSGDEGMFRSVPPIRTGGLISGISQQLLLMSIAEEAETAADQSMRAARLMAQRQRSKVSSSTGADSYDEYGEQPTKETDELGGRTTSSQLITECSDDPQTPDGNSTPGSTAEGRLTNGDSGSGNGTPAFNNRRFSKNGECWSSAGKFMM